MVRLTESYAAVSVRFRTVLHHVSITNRNLVNNLASSNPNFQVTFDLSNTGALGGAEVGQVYLGLPASTGEPPKRLVGWQKCIWSLARCSTSRCRSTRTTHPSHELLGC